MTTRRPLPAWAVSKTKTVAPGGQVQAAPVIAEAKPAVVVETTTLQLTPLVNPIVSPPPPKYEDVIVEITGDVTHTNHCQKT